MMRRKTRAALLVRMILAAFILSGCAGQGQEKEEEEPEPVLESVQAERDNPKIPKNKAGADSPYVNVDIYNEEEYRAFVGSLEEYLDCQFLQLNMHETDTVIYLDELLAYHNFSYLYIGSGGVISARNMDILKENPLEKIELDCIHAIEENIVSQMPALRDVEIWLDSSYTGALPAKELIHNTSCGEISMIWKDNRKYKVHMEEIAEWDEIDASLPGNNSYLKGLYVWNEEDCHYVSYEFCGEETEQACAAFICIRDRESYGEEYFDVLEVPVKSVEITWSGGSRMTRGDLNFDGYCDLVFMGWNRFPGEGYRECIGFLWNEKEQRYEWNSTVPKYYGGIDAERKRLIRSWTSAIEDDYFIYEYHDGIFTEKKLEVTYSMTEDRVTLQYYEEGVLLKRLDKIYKEDAKLYYITYEEDGIVTEKVMEEADYDNKYGSFMNLGKEYFPEFDFYAAG